MSSPKFTLYVPCIWLIGIFSGLKITRETIVSRLAEYAGDLADGDIVRLVYDDKKDEHYDLAFSSVEPDGDRIVVAPSKYFLPVVGNEIMAINATGERPTSQWIQCCA